jgi:hypothetical protein
MVIESSPVDALIASLLTPRYGAKSDLRELVETEVKKLAREIATAIVASEPELKAILEIETRKAVTAMLRDSVTVRNYVQRAVADALMRED